jgi:voltage-gated potassium channel
LVINKLAAFLRKHFIHVSWFSILMLLGFHAILSWVLLYLVGEYELTNFSSYLYYYVVTTSTVGYGDLSPTSFEGKLVVALVQIPLGLAIFGALLGKLGRSVSRVLRQIMTGEKDFSEEDSHILIFGWHENRTEKMVQHILGDNKRQKRKILLCVTNDLEHPFLDNPLVEFAKLKSLTQDDELTRVAVTKADRIIVDCDNDDQTFTCALKLSSLVKDECHISANFSDDTKIEMLNRYTKNIESNSSRTAEILVRSMQDPGSSRLQEEMMSTLSGHTQFSTQMPFDIGAHKFGDLFFHLKQNHNAILLAVAEDRIGVKMHLNPDNDFNVMPGQVLHYVAQERIIADEVNWTQIAVREIL